MKPRQFPACCFFGVFCTPSLNKTLVLINTGAQLPTFPCLSPPPTLIFCSFSPPCELINSRKGFLRLPSIWGMIPSENGWRIPLQPTACAVRVGFGVSMFIANANRRTWCKKYPFYQVWSSHHITSLKLAVCGQGLIFSVPKKFSAHIDGILKMIL